MLELSKLVERPVADVYRALQAVLPAQPWQLSLRDVNGAPLAGGSLVFEIPSLSLGLTCLPTGIAYYGYSD